MYPRNMVLLFFFFFWEEQKQKGDVKFGLFKSVFLRDPAQSAFSVHSV